MARHRRKSRRLGAAAGGVLGITLAPAALALADDTYGNYVFTPTSGFDVSDGGVRNFLVEVPPAAAGSVQGTEDYSVTDPSGTGTFVGDVTNTTDMFGNTNQEILVTDPHGAGAPPDGSLFDTYTYSSGIKVIYTDIPGATSSSPDTVSYSIDGFKIPIHYDALALTKPVETTLGSDTLTPTGPETIEGVNGIPPGDYDLLGTQTFTTTDGTITADIANSSDVAGNTTQDLFVTSSNDPNLPAGSVVDYFFSGSNSSSYNVYSDIPTASGDKITDTVHSTFGTFNLPTTFDAAAHILNSNGALGQEIDVPKEFDITPDGTTDTSIVGIDGIQPEDIDVQGTQAFTYDDIANPSDSGTFDANVAQSAIIFGNTTQDQYVVTSSSDPYVKDGSVFEVYNYGHGYESVYSDLVGAGPGGKDLITDYFVTPHGDIKIPDSYDASAAYLADSSKTFADPAAAATHAGLFADLLNSLDPSAAASSIDPSAGLDAASMVDPMPHIDALVNLLSGLF